MSDEQLEQLVNELAGADGWFHDDNRVRFLEAAKVLATGGFTDEAIENLLMDFYAAIAGEFGG